jgi:hypothetical protein
VVAWPAACGARFNDPSGVAVDPNGNVYVADSWNHTIRQVTPAGLVTTIAGLAGSWGSADGKGSAARFGKAYGREGPFGLAVDSTGNVYVADYWNNSIRFGATNTCMDQPTIDLASATPGHTCQLDTSPQTAVGWQWALIRQPAASSAKLSATNIRNPTFTPDVPDLYIFRLYAANAASAICIRTPSLTATPLVLSAPLVRTNGQFSLTVLSQPGSAFEIQAPTDLVSWTSLATLTNLTGTLQFTCPSPSPSHQFHRARQLP